jgi:hypothetical protein
MVSNLASTSVASNHGPIKEILMYPTCPDTGITAEIKTPTEASRALSDPDICWLKELQKMRGRVFYTERGQDGSFLSPNGEYIDADPFDSDAYHILLRAAEGPVACARVSLLQNSKPGLIATLLGREQLAQVLNCCGTTWAESCEASRWVVAPEFRNSGLGPRVVAASWALARYLELRTAFVLAGTRFGQDKMLCRMGAQPVPGIPLLPAGRIADEVRLLKFDISAPSQVTRKKIDRTQTSTPLQMPLPVNDRVASSHMSSSWPY